MGHLFDIACNFSSERFDNDLQDVIQRAIENKVNKFLIVSASLKEVEKVYELSLIHISEPTRLRRISYAVFCLKKKKNIIHKTKIYHT